MKGTSKNSCAAILHRLSPHLFAKNAHHKTIMSALFGFNLRKNTAQSCVPLVFRGALTVIKPFAFALCFIAPFALYPQSQQMDAAAYDPVSYIGLNITDLYTYFGSPSNVYAVRGIEEWQDDVVFAYPSIDFYVFKNTVWQISIKRALGVNVGDPKGAVLLVLGENALDNGSHILSTLANRNYNMQWRFNISGGKISTIYLYRMDY
ncbi:MAG: hypothetical protein Ta2G_11700 [Termitinemataceae bacterium]|nr:MAG: hypothetical protein Ta2G_11700 [Termitinemataceae bacterium]